MWHKLPPSESTLTCRPRVLRRGLAVWDTLLQGWLLGEESLLTSFLIPQSGCVRIHKQWMSMAHKHIRNILHSVGSCTLCPEGLGAWLTHLHLCWMWTGFSFPCSETGKTYTTEGSEGAREPPCTMPGTWELSNKIVKHWQTPCSLQLRIVLNFKILMLLPPRTGIAGVRHAWPEELTE